MVGKNKISMTAVLILLVLLPYKLSFSQTSKNPQMAKPVMSAQKSPPARILDGFKPYGSVELRHHLSAYYNETAQESQEPSAHFRGQLGFSLYDGFVDTYATFGFIKTPKTQQITQRRPELALDVYPLRHENLVIRQYNLVKFPGDSVIPEGREDDDALRDGSIYLVGLSSLFKAPFLTALGDIEGVFGVDGWTKFYGNKQYLEEDEDSQERYRYGLTGEAQFEEPIEDYANRYYGLQMTGVKFKPNFLARTEIGTNAYYETLFYPVYETSGENVRSYHYGVERTSFYRLRLKYSVSEKVSLINDFYQFFDDFFASKRTGDDRRIRNVARVIVRL